MGLSHIIGDFCALPFALVFVLGWLLSLWVWMDLGFVLVIRCAFCACFLVGLGDCFRFACCDAGLFACVGDVCCLFGFPIGWSCWFLLVLGLGLWIVCLLDVEVSWVCVCY